MPSFSFLKNKIKLPKNFEISHSRKIILTIIIVVIVVFAGSVVFALNKQKDTKTQSEFSSIYPQALKKYQEGQGLSDLNKNLANDSFNQAKQILEGGKDKLPKSSKEENQVLDLLAKVNNALRKQPTAQRKLLQKQMQFPYQKVHYFPLKQTKADFIIQRIIKIFIP